MQEMRDEEKAEEEKIVQEREHAEARLEPMAVLQQQVRELLPTLPTTVALGHGATIREALDIMRDKHLSCVVVVEQGQLVGIFTERDVVTTVAGAPLDIDHVQPAALVSMQAIFDTLLAAFPQELLNRPPTPAQSDAIAPTREGA